MNNIIFKTTFLKGEDGNNILRIDKTATSGLVDTYTITLTDGTTTNFQVTNGSSIATIEKTATVGMVDTYTITLTDGSTSTFEVTNGDNVTIDDQLDDDSTNPVQNKIVTGAINDIVNNLNGIVNNLNGFTFYPAGEVDLVALVADDSYYKDTNDKYVLADSPTGESLIDNVTYKSLASNEDLRGEVGADTVIPFSQVMVMKIPRLMAYQSGAGKDGSLSCIIDVTNFKTIKIGTMALSCPYGAIGDISLSGDASGILKSTYDSTGVTYLNLTFDITNDTTLTFYGYSASVAGTQGVAQFLNIELIP